MKNLVRAIILIIAIGIGIALGLNTIVPYSISKYVAVAILAFLDSIFGGITSNMQKKFNILVFLTGFFGNAIIAILLVFIGEKLNVDIYLAAVIVFSTRLFNNFSIMRRIALDMVEEKATRHEEKK